MVGTWWLAESVYFEPKIQVLLPKFWSQDFGLKVLPQSFDPKISPEVCTTNLVVMQYWLPNLYSKIFAPKFGQTMLALGDLFWSNLLAPKLTQLSNLPKLCKFFLTHSERSQNLKPQHIYLGIIQGPTHKLWSHEGFCDALRRAKRVNMTQICDSLCFNPCFWQGKFSEFCSFSEKLDFLKYIVMKDANWDYDFI